MQNAILQAANQIEQYPRTFNFMSPSIPKDDGVTHARGCALAWIGFYLSPQNPDRYRSLGTIAEAVGASDEAGFYERMNKLSGNWFIRQFRDKHAWKNDAQVCADRLRKYADKYYPEAA